MKIHKSDGHTDTQTDTWTEPLPELLSELKSKLSNRPNFFLDLLYKFAFNILIMQTIVETTRCKNDITCIMFKKRDKYLFLYEIICLTLILAMKNVNDEDKTHFHSVHFL